MIRADKKAAFTIVELMLAMTFVSFLMVAVVLMTMQLSRIYTKGNTMRNLNTAGRTINSDFTTTFNSISVINWRGKSSDFGYGEHFVMPSDGSGSGAFCTGRYSYLWNGATILNSKTTGKVVPIRFAGKAQSDSSLRLVKINDPSASYCSSRAGWESVPEGGSVVNLLPPGDTNLMIYGIDFQSNDGILYDQASNQRVVNASYILGTANDHGTVNVSGMTCQPPASAGGMEDYCAINKFELTVRTLGRG